MKQDVNQIDRIFEKLILFSLFFPYIPSIIPSSDTQPLFLLISISNMLYIITIYGHQYTVPMKKTFAVLIITLTIIIVTLFGNMFNKDPFLVSRFVSFLQLLLSIVYISLNRVYLNVAIFKRIIITYCIFTLIFFLTSGLVERILISSRSDELYQSLIKSGRGGSTLSPEPSFFALIIFNIFVLSRLYNIKFTIFKIPDYIIYIMLLFSSLSGYGFLLACIIVFYTFPLFSIFSVSFVLLLSPFLQVIINKYLNIRFIYLISLVLKKGILYLLTADASTSTRVNSMIQYLRYFIKTLPIGDGFSIYGGGGFVSILSALGIIGLLLLFFIIIRIISKTDFNLTLKVLLLLWFIVNFISGPIGLPILGVIIGLIIGKERLLLHNGK